MRKLRTVEKEFNKQFKKLKPIEESFMNDNFNLIMLIHLINSFVAQCKNLFGIEKITEGRLKMVNVEKFKTFKFNNFLFIRNGFEKELDQLKEIYRFALKQNEKGAKEYNLVLKTIKNEKAKNIAFTTTKKLTDEIMKEVSIFLQDIRKDIKVIGEIYMFVHLCSILQLMKIYVRRGTYDELEPLFQKKEVTHLRRLMTQWGNLYPGLLKKISGDMIEEKMFEKIIGVIETQFLEVLIKDNQNSKIFQNAVDVLREYSIKKSGWAQYKKG